MREYITDKVEEIQSVLYLKPVEFWVIVCGFLLGTWAITIYTNSRHANPVCIDFEVQNQQAVKYENRKQVSTMARMYSTLFKNAKTKEEKARILKDYNNFKKVTGFKWRKYEK